VWHQRDWCDRQTVSSKTPCAHTQMKFERQLTPHTPKTKVRRHVIAHTRKTLCGTHWKDTLRHDRLWHTSWIHTRLTCLSDLCHARLTCWSDVWHALQRPYGTNYQDRLWHTRLTCSSDLCHARLTCWSDVWLTRKTPYGMQDEDRLWRTRLNTHQTDLSKWLMSR